jgi:hypothetical protein
MVKNGKSNKNKRVRRVVDVSLQEVSGICSRRSRSGQMSVIAVGDRAAKVAWCSVPRSDEGRIDWHKRNMANLSGSILPEHDPQIEDNDGKSSAKIFNAIETKANILQ